MKCLFITFINLNDFKNLDSTFLKHNKWNMMLIEDFAENTLLLSLSPLTVLPNASFGHKFEIFDILYRSGSVYYLFNLRYAAINTYFFMQNFHR